MKEIEKYKTLTKDKPFSYCVKIALLLLNEEQVYEVLEEDASKAMVKEGQPVAIFERIVSELLGLKVWYLPDEIKIWNRKFGRLFEGKYFCYDDDAETWSKILHKYFVKLQYIPQKEDYNSMRSFNNAWGYFAEILAVTKANHHPEFEKYYQIAKEKGMSDIVLERKMQELSEIKQRFAKI